LYVGIDRGQRRVHLVALDENLNLDAARVVDVADLAGLRQLLERASVVAIDAPEALSTAPHANDESLPPKFRSARCAEIALGREHAIWVPWTTPTPELPLPPCGRQSCDLAWAKIQTAVAPALRAATLPVDEASPVDPRRPSGAACSS
jgi:hypothetical protein